MLRENKPREEDGSRIAPWLQLHGNSFHPLTALATCVQHYIPIIKCIDIIYLPCLSGKFQLNNQSGIESGWKHLVGFDKVMPSGGFI